MRFHYFLVVLFFVSALARAQSVIPVGAGSYASSVPPDAKATAGQIESQPIYIVTRDGRPLPSNHWWTQLLVAKFAKSLWAFPFKIDTSEKGLAVFLPTHWSDSGSDPVSDVPLQISAENFTPVDSRAKNWSDWLVSFRLGNSPDNPSQFIDVTLGEGIPYTYLEYSSPWLHPLITLPNEVRTSAKCFTLTGQPATFPLTADTLLIQYQNRQYALFAPDQTTFTRKDEKITATFSGKDSYLILAALPHLSDASIFHSHAFTLPRSTEFSWQVDPVAGLVNTTWKIQTQPLKGTDTQTIQGWIPHHYNGTTSDLHFTTLDFLSPRGKLRCTIGNEFHIAFPFNGILPNLPAPQQRGGQHDYDPVRMHQYLAEIASKPNYGNDTYWGGKDVLRFAQATLMAQQTQDELYPKLLNEVHTAMTDWLTYTPGEKSHYFARYPNWKALLGISTSYGSEGFNDHHFHYGYFTFATALLAMHDPQFVADFGPMATQVAKEYANYDRTDQNFPFLRTFDIWAGHSWAGGTSSPGGNNQESSSEAVQSWAGLLYLGQALDNKQMADAGVMGYAIESHATMQYWFNESGDTFPPEWKHPVTGMIWSGGKVYGTYFTGDPAWVYAIQWLPASPMLSYLVHDPAAAKKRYEQMTADFNAHEIAESQKPRKPNERPYTAKTASIQTFGAALGSVMLGYQLMYDPNTAAAELDNLYISPTGIAHDASEFAVIYYQTHAMRNLGRIDWAIHGSSPTTMTYLNPTDNTHTFIAWNPLPTPKTITFYQNNKPLGTFTAPPQALSSTHTLTP